MADQGGFHLAHSGDEDLASPTLASFGLDKISELSNDHKVFWSKSHLAKCNLCGAAKNVHSACLVDIHEKVDQILKVQKLRSPHSYIFHSGDKNL